MFGEHAVGDTGHAGESRAAGMADSAEVCGCNGVCKGTIVKAIREQGLFTVDEIKKHTKAASSCGSCTGLVEQILINCVGGAADVKPSSEKPACGCTAYPRRAAPRHPRASPDPRGRCDGLHGMAHAGRLRDLPSRHQLLPAVHLAGRGARRQPVPAGQRAHARQHPEATAPIPWCRACGRRDHASELRRIADVADKYAIPMVKVTGGQRIDLLGVRKEDLPKVWQDLTCPRATPTARACAP